MANMINRTDFLKSRIISFFLFTVSLFFVFEAFGADMSANELFEKASLDLKNHKLSSAQENISKAIEIDGNNPQFYIFRAKVSSYKNNREAVSKDLENAERSDPQFYQIYAFKAAALKNAFGREQSYLINLNKADLFEQLQGKNIKLPRNIFGMTASDFNAVSGSQGYVEVDFDSDFKEDSLKETPFAGKSVKRVFKKISVNRKGVSLSKEATPGDYEVTAYRLETCLLGTSGKSYRFFYWIKYRKKSL
jgi:hypothetical protein